MDNIPQEDNVISTLSLEELSKGFNEEEAIAEANRCLQCKKPMCVRGCPVNINIPDFINQIKQGNFQEAVKKLKTQTALPAVCGRVCPQESQCEGSCVLRKRKPISIGKLERFVADYVRENNLEDKKEKLPDTGKKVAIVGTGPAGITVAGDLASLGHKVVMFEALGLAGGVLMYGIPRFRLPKRIVTHEINALKNLGVEIFTNRPICEKETIKDLLEKEGFDAVFVGAGVGTPIMPNIEGENAKGVYPSNEFLAKFNLKEYLNLADESSLPIKAKHIITIGGGNVAMDSARTALRLGAKSTIVYRRTKDEMPARAEEIESTEEEGVDFSMLTAPKRIITNEEGFVIGLECTKMQLTDPDESGRRRPEEVPNSLFTIEADAIVIAIGNKINPIILSANPDLNFTSRQTIEVNENLKTNLKGVFAGGDIVLGASTVVSAMGQGKIAARAINSYLESL